MLIRLKRRKRYRRFERFIIRKRPKVPKYAGDSKDSKGPTLLKDPKDLKVSKEHKLEARKWDRRPNVFQKTPENQKTQKNRKLQKA